MTPVRPWDIVRFRIRPQDTELPPGIVVSGEEWCASVAQVIGRVSLERRRAIGRKINEVLRLLL